jgi:hypothetical protein
MSGTRRSFQEPQATIANTGTFGGNLTDLAFTDQVNAAAPGGYATGKITEQQRLNIQAQVAAVGTLATSAGVTVTQGGIAYQATLPQFAGTAIPLLNTVGTLASSAGVTITQGGTAALAPLSLVTQGGFTIGQSIAATGTTQGTAALLTYSANIITSASAGNLAVQMGLIGTPQDVWNTTTISLSVFPETGYSMVIGNGTTLSTNAAASFPGPGHLRTLQVGTLCLTAP